MESDNQKDKRPFTVVLHEFIVFEVEFVRQVVGKKFGAIVATEFYFLRCRKVSIRILIWINA